MDGDRVRDDVSPDGDKLMRKEFLGAESDAAVFERLARGRRSCRAFLSRPVPRADLIEIFRVAQQAPSWCNSQPWQANVVSQPVIDELRQVLLAGRPRGRPDFDFPVEYPAEYGERRRHSGWMLYEAVGIQRGDRQASALQARKNLRFFGAPHVAFITSARPLGVYGAVDCGVYVAHLLLAAESRGISAIPQAALARFSVEIKSFLDIDDERSLLCGVSLGYDDSTDRSAIVRPPRAAMEDVVKFHDH